MARRRRIEEDETETRASQERLTDQREFDESESLADEVRSPLHIPMDRWPEGKVLRWVRIEANQAVDNKNWAQMTAVGWTPVDRSVFPDLFPMVPMPGQGDVSDGKIIFGGLCLCMRDKRLVLRDKKRQEQETIAQNDSINSYVEEAPGNFPRFNQSGPVQYERAAFKE